MRVRVLCVACLFIFQPTTGFARTPDSVPLKNWSVSPDRTAVGREALSTMADISPGVGYVAMQPCRVVDTRPSQGFTGPYGPPILQANAIRTFDIDSGPCSGIPAGVEAYSLNFAVTETTGQPGDIRAWPTGNPPFTVTSVLNWNFVGASAIANSIIIPAGTNGAIDVQVAGFNTHLVIDINGYFTDAYNNGNQFVVVGNVAGGGALLGTNTTTATNSSGIRGIQGAAFPTPSNYFAAGVRGESTTTGVLGVSQSLGVAGSLVNGAGAETAYGILGFNTGNQFGVYGFVAGGDVGDAAVFGTSEATGVLGVSQDGTPVAGRNLSGTGTLQTAGMLAPDSIYGVFAVGNVGASGTKPFVEPHPVDPTKEIVFVALEGPEAGTYFRGRGKFQRGVAVIDVPEDFRMVTDPEDLGIQVTPIGEMSTVAVVSIGLDRIVVKGSRDVAFFYTVNGVRKAFRDHASIAPNVHYVPEGPSARMPGAYAPEQRRRLIETGIYNEDGTVNMETARRLGWDRVWEERSRPAPQPTMQ
jgi:hypothetical protein